MWGRVRGGFNGAIGRPGSPCPGRGLGRVAAKIFYHARTILQLCCVCCNGDDVNGPTLRETEREGGIEESEREGEIEE